MVSQWFILPLYLCLIFVVGATISFLLCYIAKSLFSRFRSGEFKPGPHRSDIRSDLPASGRDIKTIELPLVGGPAMILALMATAIGALGLRRESTESAAWSWRTPTTHGPWISTCRSTAKCSQTGR